MPSTGGCPEGPSSPAGPRSGDSTLASEPPSTWANPSPTYTTAGGEVSRASADATPPETPSSAQGPPTRIPVAGFPAFDKTKAVEALQNGREGKPSGYDRGSHVASPAPRGAGSPSGSLSFRSLRAPTQGAPLHATAGADIEGPYVHLTDSDHCNSADEAETRSRSPGAGVSFSRLGRDMRFRFESLFLSLSAFTNLVIRRLTLGFRFLQFWAKDNQRQLKVFLYATTLLISSTGNTITFKRMLDRMSNYSGFLNQLTNFVFIPVFAALCIHQYSVGKLSQAVLSFPKKNFALMGCLDGVCGIMAVIGGIHTSGTAQVVLSQLGIPAMLILCRVMLGKKYNAIQHLGAAVIIVGVLVVESPGLLHPTKEDSANIPFFNLIFLLSLIPSSLSFVVKEIAFRGVQMNTCFLQFWVALFQFLVGFALLPLTSLPRLGPEVVPLGQLWGRLVNGGRCLMEVNSIVPPNCGVGVGVPCDTCEGAWVEVLVYVVFNLIYNMSAMLVLKHCGATVLFLVMTVRLPLTSMAFYSKLIVGDSAVPPRATDFFGLVILLIGLLAFRLGGQKHGGDDEEQGHEEGVLEEDITASAEAAHMHIKVLASDSSIRHDGYFQFFSDEESPTPPNVRRRNRRGTYMPPSMEFEGPAIGATDGPNTRSQQAVGSSHQF